MEVKSKILSLVDTDLWNDYIIKLPIDQQDVYFTPEYYSLYEEYGDGLAQCFVYEEDEEFVLYPFLKNNINELGYELDDKYYDIQGAYGYNGIVTTSKDKEFLSNFYRSFEVYCNDNNIVAEFTRFHPLLKNYEIASGKCKVIFDRKTVSVDITKEESEIWLNQIERGNRNTIKKALKNELHFEADHDFKYLDEFISLYNKTMNKLDANDYYYFNHDYYLNFVNKFKKKSFIGVVKYQDKIISSALFMYDGVYGHYHLSGSDIDYLKLCPNNLLLYGAILEFKKLGIKQIHLGGGTSLQKDDTLLKFKSKFGKIENDFYIGKTIYNQNIYDNIVKQWANKYPELYAVNKVKLLGYRDIK